MGGAYPHAMIAPIVLLILPLAEIAAALTIPGLSDLLLALLALPVAQVMVVPKGMQADEILR